MENNELETYSTPEKITAAAIIFALLMIPVKFIYYDTGGLSVLKIVFPIVLIAIIIALVILKDLRQALFMAWLRLMVYMPVAVIGLIVLAIIYYIFQEMFQSGPADVGNGE